MATSAPETSPTPAIPASAPVLATIPVPPPPVTGTTTLQVQMLPPEKPAFWEGPGFFPACAALLAVGVAYYSLQRSTKKQIEATALRTKEQLDHASNQAKEERAHAAAQATEERDYSASQATKDRLMKLREELYPALIDEYVDVQVMFGLMPTTDYAKNPNAAQALQKMAASVNKTWIFSSVETALIVREFYTALNEMHLRLLKQMPGINHARERYEYSVGGLQKLAADELRVLQQLQDRRIMDPTHASFPVHVLAKQQLEDELKSIEDASKMLERESQKYKAALRAATDKFMTTLIAEQTNMMRYINHVMASVRKELGQEGDTAVLEAQSEDMSRRITAAMEDFKQSPAHFAAPASTHHPLAPLPRAG